MSGQTWLFDVHKLILLTLATLKVDHLGSGSVVVQRPDLTHNPVTSGGVQVCWSLNSILFVIFNQGTVKFFLQPHNQGLRQFLSLCLAIHT